MNLKRILLAGAAISTLILANGCSGPKQTAAAAPTPAPAAAPAMAQTPAPAPATAPMAMMMPIRIKAGLDTPLTNSDGTIWLAQQGFTEGTQVQRPDAQITNTKEPGIYQSELYSMTAFNWPLPNGKYIVKLHFCETYKRASPGRVSGFSRSLSRATSSRIWIYLRKVGALHAYIETVPVEITDGKLNITFTPNIENPQICGIEIFPNP